MTGLSNVLDLLRSDGSIVVNKRLAKEIGLVEAIIYSELASLYKYWQGRGQLTDGEWFFCTFANLEENTTIKERTARKHVNQLKKLGLIESKLMGLPSKKYYRITDGIFEVLGLVPDKVGKNYRTDNNNDLKSGSAEEQRDDKVGKNYRTRPERNADVHQQKLPGNNTRTNNTNLNNKKERENIIKDSKIEQDLKDYLIKRSSDFETQGINLQSVLNWIESNNDFYTFTEFAVGIDQILDFPEKVENPLRLLNSTFGDIEKYVELARKKDLKKIDKQLSEEKHLHQQISEVTMQQPKVKFYNWLEDQN